MQKSPLVPLVSTVTASCIVAISVVDRREDDDKVFEQGVIPLKRQFTREHEQRFLAADFAGMDVAEPKDDRFAGGLGLLGGRNGRVGEDHQWNRSTLVGNAQLAAPHDLRLSFNVVQQVDYFGVSSRLVVVRLLRDGQQIAPGSAAPGIPAPGLSYEQ